jgi:hypothetical protein
MWGSVRGNILWNQPTFGVSKNMWKDRWTTLLGRVCLTLFDACGLCFSDLWSPSFSGTSWPLIRDDPFFSVAETLQYGVPLYTYHSLMVNHYGIGRPWLARQRWWKTKIGQGHTGHTGPLMALFGFILVGPRSHCSPTVRWMHGPQF